VATFVSGQIVIVKKWNTTVTEGKRAALAAR